MHIDFKSIELIKKLKNGICYLGSSIVALLFSLFTFPIYSTYLSAEDFGLIGYFSSLQGFIAPLFNLSMSSFFLMRYFKQHESENKKDLFNILFYLSVNNVIVSCLFLIIGFYYFQKFTVSYPFFPFSILIISMAYFQPYTLFLLQQYRIREEGGKYFIFAVLAPLSNALLSLLLIVYFDLGVVGRMAGMSLSTIFLGTTCIVFLKKFVSPNYSFREFKSKIISILPLVFASYAYIPIESFDRIFLERLKMPEILGLYSIGRQMSGYFLVAATAIFKAYEPTIFHSIINNNKDAFKKAIIQYLLILLIGYLVFFFLLDPIISLLTRNKFVGAVYYAKYLSLAKLISSISLIFGAVILAMQKTNESAYVIYATSLCAIILYPLFTMYWGFDGALVAAITVPLVGMLVNFCLIKKVGFYNNEKS